MNRLDVTYSLWRALIRTGRALLRTALVVVLVTAHVGWFIIRNLIKGMVK